MASIDSDFGEGAWEQTSDEMPPIFLFATEAGNCPDESLVHESRPISRSVFNASSLALAVKIEMLRENKRFCTMDNRLYLMPVFVSLSSFFPLEWLPC